MNAPARATHFARQGAILLEVLFALALFVAALGVIGGSLSASVRAGRWIKMEARAADLAVTLLSQIQSGQVSLEDDGPNEYDDEALAGWTWQVAIEKTEEDSEGAVAMDIVHVTVANTDQNFKYTLTQFFLPASDDTTESTE